MVIGRASVSFFLLSLILTVNIYHAQLGEIAGAFVMNMSIGSTIVKNWTLSNTGDFPINYRIIPPQFAPVPNATAPIVTASPMNGTIAPHSSINIAVAITLPYLNNKAGIKWDSVIGSIGTPLNYTQNFGGAQIQSGVGKEIVIRAQPPLISLYELVGAAIAVVAVIGGSAYYYKFKFLPKYNSKESKAARAKRKKEAERAKLAKMEAAFKAQRAKLLSKARAVRGAGNAAPMAKPSAKKPKGQAKGSRAKASSARKKRRK